MNYARHEAVLRQTDESGFSARDHLEGLVARGNASDELLAKLEGPPLPAALAYMWDWTLELHGRSGFSQVGVHPLSYSTIADWARLNDLQPQPHEVQGLLALDAILCSKPKPEDAE